MTEFFEMFIVYISEFWFKLDEFGFEFFGFTVTLPSMIVSFLLIGLVISFFWKGAKT